MAGRVYLVGAGPGDPGLITVKGRAALERADAVLYDHLAPRALLDLAPAAAERVYVGKKKAAHSHTQAEIAAMLIARARQGQTVVRLKGGDPYIFGRGGEEAEALYDAGVPFEVIPGVTSPLGLAAYGGVPLTHREHTSVVTFITGHELEKIDWAAASRAETLVIFMGLTNLPEIARRLLAAGRSGSTPALAVRWATRPDQRAIEAPLAELPARVAEARLKPPVTIVIGEVVRLRPKLAWYERLPLFGQRVVVTRARGQADALASRLAALGAEVRELPTIEVQPLEDYSRLDAALGELETFDWLIFTSVNGVRFFLERLDRSGRDLRALRGRLCAIGPATRAAVEALHLRVDVMGKEYIAESLVAELSAEPLEGKRILLARAAIARDVLPRALRARGADVVVAEAYRTVPPEGLRAAIETLFQQGPPPDWVTFTSSSTVENFATHAAPELLPAVRAASIGPVTSATARKWGIPVAAEASSYDIEGLVTAILTKGIIEQ